MIAAPLRLALGLLSPGGTRARLSILTYHRVLPAADPLVPWAESAEVFAIHMAALARYFTVLPLPEAIDRLARGTLPPRAAAVTFDDGYRDNLTVALPILRRFDIPATVFVASGFLDGGRMWNDTIVEAVRAAPDGLDLDDLGLGRIDTASPEARVTAVAALLKQVKYLPPERRAGVVARIGERAGRPLPDDLMLSTAEVRTLHAAGIDIGGHTVSHPILARLDDGVARREIAENRACLVDIVRAPVAVFAYPNGRPGQDFRPVHAEMARDCGYAGAVTTVAGTSAVASDPYLLRRYGPWGGSESRFVTGVARNFF